MLRTLSLDEALLELTGPKGLARLNTRIQQELRAQQMLEELGVYISEDDRKQRNDEILGIVKEALSNGESERAQSSKTSMKVARGNSFDRLLTFLTKPNHHRRIQKWRQGIENKKARDEHREPRLILVKTANRDFHRALKSDRSPYTKSAQKLAQTLIKQSARVAPSNKSLAELDVGQEARMQIEAACAHFGLQAKDKRVQVHACESGLQKTLLKQQAACFANLECALAGTVVRMNDENIMEDLGENPSLTLKPDDPTVIAYKDYARYMKKAVMLGLGSDPYVRAWFTHH